MTTELTEKLIVETERWAVYRHPIARPIDNPVPMIAAGDYATMEGLFFDLCEDPDEDEFYLELAPYQENYGKGVHLG